MESSSTQVFYESIERTKDVIMSSICRSFFVNRQGQVVNQRYGLSPDDLFQEAFLSALKFVEKKDTMKTIPYSNNLDPLTVSIMMRHAEWVLLQNRKSVYARKQREVKWSDLNVMDYDTSFEQLEVDDFMMNCSENASIYIKAKMKKVPDSKLYGIFGSRGRLYMVRDALRANYKELKE